ncbi:hypothetical protein [Nocardioides sp. URHA0020]|uniref:hypothetical protein n=1 Tax=Nocardioides sp. URHA0020 TaxID=1380392 RepID=UPI00048EE534|nr:hypothetical protein [Nocardioides sp. URHA0020]
MPLSELAHVDERTTLKALSHDCRHARIWPVSTLRSVLRSEFGRWLLLSLAVVAFGAVGILRVPSTDASTAGDITGFGFRMDGKECYFNVAYTVHGAQFHMKSPHGQRWCDYQPLFRRESSVVVYYDSSHPETATLTPRGRTPVAAVAIGLAGVVACCFFRMRRPRQRTALEQSASHSGIPTA